MKSKNALKGAFLACLLLSVCASAEEITIGVWNIQHLGNPDKRPKAVRNIAQKPQDLAEYIRESEVAILGLSEICDDKPSNNKLDNSTLDDVCDLLSDGQQGKWKYVLFQNRDLGDRSQVCGVLWDENRVTKEGDHYRIPLKIAAIHKDKSWDRHPTAVKFRLSKSAGKTDIVLIPLHMKSNVSRAGDDTSLVRKREALTLIKALGKVEEHFGDHDIVLLGDTNIASESEGALDIFALADFEDLSGGTVSSYYTGKVAFDRIFVRRDRSATADSEMEVVDRPNMVPKEFLKRFSDHYMVTTTVVVGADDDE